jgi:predicted RecB family nuclease
MEKRLSEITREEWITFQWVDITEMGDSERMMLQRFQRTPDEMMQAMEDWEETEQFRVVKQ